MAEKFEVLSDREHTLLKAHIMVGGLRSETMSMFIDGKRQDVNCVPALLTIVREIIDNSVDEFIRSGKTAATKIDITMTRDTLTVVDNGRGIPVVEHFDKEKGITALQPVLCWTRLRAGTSFHGHDMGPSSNGVGSSVANILSTKFTGETCDGKKKCLVVCSDNMANINVQTTNCRNAKTGTKVTMTPDFARFGETHFTDDHIKASRERIIALSAAYPEITFTFNGEKIRSRDPKEYLSRFGEKYVSVVNENYVVGVFPTDNEEYSHVTHIEGLWIRNGGTHEQWFSKELADAMRGSIKRKYKVDLTPNEIRRGLLLVIDGRAFPNLKFDSQTKERLTNSEAEVKAWFGEIDFSKVAAKVIDTPEIIEPIVEAKVAKLLAAERRANTIAQKKMAKKHVEKHVAAKWSGTNKRELTTLFLCEGDSAASTMRRVRDINIHGCFPMRGAPKNTWGASEKEILDNAELNNIMAILGLRFGMKDEEIDSDLSYGDIGIMCDADTDGAGHIQPLIVNFLSRWGYLFTQGKVKIVSTPRYVFTKNRGKSTEVRHYCYNKEEYEQALPKHAGWELRYIKGLGTLRAEEYADAINDKTHWLTIELDDPKCLDIMFGDDVNARREIMGI